MMKKTVKWTSAMVAAVFVFAAVRAQAATWDVTKTGTQSWDDNANWTTTPFPNAIGATADLRVNIAGTLTINLNQAITVGTLYIGDTNQSHATTIAGNGGSLIMDVASGTALISKTYSGTSAVVETISANIQLNDDVVVNNSSNHYNRRFILSGVISGVGRSLEVTGAGAAVVMANANTYSGTTTVTSGVLQLGSGSTGGDGSVAGNMVNNGTLHFNNVGAQTLSGANYSGSGTLLKSAAGKLTLTGATTVANLSIGSISDGGTIEVASGGSLSVGSGSGNSLNVGLGAYDGTLDASAATSFSANVGTFAVGSSATTGANATLKLSGTDNAITASTAVYIGWDTSLNASGNSGAVTSAGNTSITTPIMGLGTSKIATGTYTQTAGTFTLAGPSATGTEMLLGYTTNNDGSRTATGTVDLSAVSANLKLSKLVMADNNGTGAHTKGSLLLSNNAANHLEIKGSGNVVALGLARNSGGTGGTADIATLTIGHLDATSAIESTTSGATAVLIASKTGSGTVQGIFNFNSGTLKITTVDGGAAIAGGGGTSRLYLGETGHVTLKAGAASTDWIHGLTTAEIKGGGATIDTNGFDLGISQGFSGGGLIKAGEGNLTLSGTSSHESTTVAEGSLTVTGTVNGAVDVADGGTLHVAAGGFVGAIGALTTVQAGGTLGGGGTINGELKFESGAKLLFDPTTTLTLNGNMMPATFGAGFGVASLVGLNASVEYWTYTLITGDVDLSGVANVGIGNAYFISEGKYAYFEEGSLNLVVTSAIPEPATLGLLGVAGLAMLLKRRRAKR